MGKRRVASVESAASGPLFNIIRRDYVGDPGKQVGANISQDRAEEYIQEHQEAGEQADFEIVKS